MEQFVFLLVVGAVAFVKWLLEKSAELREKNKIEQRIDQLERSQPPAPPMQAPRPTAFPMPNLEAAERQLRRALGLPEESDLPTARKRTPALPPEPVFTTEEVEGAPMVDLEQRTFLPPPVPAEKPPVFRPPAKPPAAAAPAMRTRIHDLLKSRDGLRTAVLAQEILGTPKGLVF